MTKVAVVTGAAGGIGSATCDVLARDGWDVVAVDRHTVDREGSIQLDIGDADAVTAALGGLAEVHGLVNCAALPHFQPIADTTIDAWDTVMAVNLRGAFICLKAVYDMLLTSRGAVVNVGSVHAHATSRSIAAYAATKGGLSAFSRAAALELAPAGVRVNAVLPGAVDTPALRDGFARRENAERDLIGRTPLGRVGKAAEIAEAIAFLLDDKRSGFITGQEIVVDGGALARLGTE